MVVFAVTGCAAKTDWSLTNARTCMPKDAPRVCVVSEPDYGHVIEVGDVELLPGECVAAPAGSARGGLLDVETRDGEGEVRGRFVRAPRGHTTVLEIEAAGRPRTRGHVDCDGTPVNVDATARHESRGRSAGASARREPGR